jgi:hydroxymethylbilane synthase
MAAETNDPQIVRIGTRGSALARWQTDYVARLLRNRWPDMVVEVEVISTRGDRVLDVSLPKIGGKGLFTAELEDGLRERRIDLAVHSLKDLPTEMPADLCIGAIPNRANPADVLVSRGGNTLDELPRGATIGTSSVRRASQLLAFSPDFKIIDIRGNVDSRLKKALDPDGPYDGVVFARAGLERLGLLDESHYEIPGELMIPAPGQGALAIQCREEDAFRELLAPLNDADTELAVTAERAFLEALGGGCSLPIAAHGAVTHWSPEETTARLIGRVLSPDGASQVEVGHAAPVSENPEPDIKIARDLGLTLAMMAIENGALEILSEIE